jgi:hypothetical protein
MLTRTTTTIAITMGIRMMRIPEAGGVCAVIQ